MLGKLEGALQDLEKCLELHRGPDKEKADILLDKARINFR